MNKYYFIIPAFLLGGFIFLYRGALSEMKHKEETQLAQKAADKAAEDARRIEVEKRAQADAEKRQKDREILEQEKLAKKEKDYNDAMAKLKHETDGYVAESNKLTKDVADLEVALTKGQALRDKTNLEAFELSKQVELSKINRRSAELEIQRLVEMVGTKASTLAAMPPPPLKK